MPNFVCYSDSGAPRARSPVAKKIWLSINPKNVGNHMAVRPPFGLSVRTTVDPMSKVKQSSMCASLQPNIAHRCCGQLTAVKTRYPVTSIT